MTDKKIADFEWASISRYVGYVEQVAGLQQVSLNKVHSLRVGLAGVTSLLKAKCKTREAIRENNRRLCLFVGSREETLGQAEKDVIRGMYMSNRSALETLGRHIQLLETMSQTQQSLFPAGDDNLPF